MKILAIETSCDDTGISVLDIKEKKNSLEFSVLSNIVSSQTAMGKKYGGVFPAMAKREHQRNLVPAFIKALRESKLLKISNSQFSISNEFSMTKFSNVKKILDREPELEKKLVSFLKKYTKPDIDLISVTNGPGLEPCLWAGVNFAKALSYVWEIPVVPVNHIESHILVNFLDNPSTGSGQVKFPSIALVVSGGHTQIILVKAIGKYEILGETRDDAAGECFDKCAKILGLGYPGGPIIAAKAAKFSISNSQFPIKLPRPMIGTKDYDFSFSGLKTAVLYHHQKQNKKTQKSKKYITDMCAEVQQAIIDVLIKKTMKAVKDYKAKSLILGGGVSANKELRKQFLFEILNSKFEIQFWVPDPKLSTDNALMTAITGFYHKKIATSDVAKIIANGNLRISK